MPYKVVNDSKGKVLLEQAEIADTFWRRLSGLMFRKSLPEGKGLIFYNANSIHTCFMRFSLDIVFLDKDGRVVRIKREMKPWRATICLKAFTAIEFPSCYSYTEDLESGDFLKIVPCLTS